MKMPTTKPTRPTMAFRSPPPIRQRAAQEHQGADHNEHTQYKAQGRGGTAAAFEFLKAKSSDEGAQYNADDLGADVLDHACGVQAQGTGGIPQEARNTEAHVAGVAGELQKDGYQAEDKARDHDARGGREEIEAVFHATPQRRDAAKVGKMRADP